MTPFSRSTENFLSNGGTVILSNLKTRREKVGKDGIKNGLFSTISYLTHTEKPIRNPDPADPEPKNPSGSDPEPKSRVSV